METEARIVHFQSSLDPAGEGPTLCTKIKAGKGMWVTIDRNLVTCRRCKEIIARKHPLN